MTKRLGTLLVTLGLLLSPSLLGARGESPWGINVHAPEEERLRLLFDRTAAAGIGWVRIDFVWAAVEPEPGLVDWTVYDDIVAAARARGLRILALVAYTPGWATDGLEIAGAPRNTDDWSDFCYRAARRYRNGILHWEIWNEPNLPRFWTGSRLQYIEGILEPAARAIRAANPDARIGGPGLAHFVTQGRDWHAWLLDILREARDELDFLTHHAYDLEDPRGVMRKLLGATPSGDEPAGWKEEPPSLREVLAHASWDRPVWLTETGWVTTRLDESGQADHYGSFLDLWTSPGLRPPWLEKVFFYELQDDRNPNVPNYGILRVSGRKKPAYRVLRRFITAREPGDGDGDDRVGDRWPRRPRLDRPEAPVP